MFAKLFSIIKQIIKEFVPPILLRLLRYFRNNKPYQSPVEEDISSLRKKHGLQFTVDSIIIGNGPSLKHVLENHIDFFHNKTIFCVNDFVVSNSFEVVRPLFNLFHDPGFWDRNCSQFSRDYIDRVLALLKEKVKWRMFLLLPSTARDWNWFQDLPSENNRIILAYYPGCSPCANTCIDDKHRLYKTNQAIISSETVLVAATFISLNLGFKTSYLVGADMSMHENIFVNKDNVLCVFDRHGHDNHEPEPVPMMHWRNDGSTLRIHELFISYSLMHLGFVELEEYARFLGATIYNASHKSYIDAFERYDLDER